MGSTSVALPKGRRMGGREEGKTEGRRKGERAEKEEEGRANRRPLAVACRTAAAVGIYT